VGLPEGWKLLWWFRFGCHPSG